VLTIVPIMTGLVDSFPSHVESKITLRKRVYPRQWKAASLMP
jgi:hypothetical protein